MQKILKPLLLTVTLVVAVAFIVCCGMLLWIKSSRGLEWVQSRINAAIPGQITIAGHDLALLLPRLELSDAVLFDPEGLALAGFGHFSVQLDWWALLRREIRLDRVVLQDPWADLRVDQTRGVNLMAALVPPDDDQAPTPGELPFNIVLNSLQLSDGRLSFSIPEDNLHLATTGITLSANGDLKARRAGVDLELADVRLRGAGIRPQPARLNLKAHLDGGKLRLTALDVASGQTHLKLSGSAEDLFSTPRLDSTLVIDSQTAELKTLFNLTGDYSAPLHARLTLQGALANPDAGLVVKSAGGRIAGQPLDHAELSLNLQDRQVTIDSLAWQLGGGTLSLDGTLDLRRAFPTGFLTAPADIDAIAYALTLASDIPDLEPWLQPMLAIGGQMTGRVAIDGKGVMPAAISARLEWVASGQDLHAPGMDRPVSADLKLSARMNRGRLDLARLEAAVDSVKLTGSGHFQLDDRTLAGNLAISAEDLSRALAVMGIPSVEGACDALLTAAGSLTRPQLSVNLQTRDLKIKSYAVGNLTVDAAMDADGRLNLTGLSLHNNGSRIQGNGRLRWLPDGGGIDPRFGNALNLTLDALSLADFMQSPPLTGSLAGRLRVEGPLGSLKGALSLDGRQLKTPAATIGDVTARLHLNDGIVRLDRLQLRNRGSAVSAAGSIRLLAPGKLHPVENPSFDVSLASDHLDPGDFIDNPVHGDFSFEGDLAGSVNDPVGKLTLKGSRVDLAGQPIESLALDARFEAGRVWLDRLLAAVAPAEQIEGSGWIGLDKTAELHLKSDGIMISRIQRLHDVFPAEGRLRFDATGQGSVTNPDIDGRLTVSDVSIQGETIQDVDLRFSLHDKQASAAGNLNFELEAACDLNRGNFDVRLLFDDTETASYFKIAGQPDLHGTLTGRVQAAGNFHDAADLTANVALDAVDLFFKNTPLIQSDRISLHLADRQLTISEFELTLLSAGSLRLEGDARLDGRLDLALDGRIPLAAAGVFSEELADAVGTLALSGTVSGDTADPRVDARIDLQGIGMTVPGLVQKLHDLNGRIVVTSDHVRIEALSGMLDTGKFSLNGLVNHKGFEPRQINLTLAAQSLPLEIPDTLTLMLNGDIKIAGDHRSADARGQIVLLEGLYYKDVKINLLKLATARQRAVAPATEPVTLPYFDTVNLDIAIRNRQPFLVQNNLAELEISPDLKIGGTLAQPVVSGRAQVKSGTVTFQKKTFEVNKGVIDFVNPYKTEAEIDIESQSQIRSWTITLAIKGTPDNLDLQLSSVPSETDSDILSLILFGRTAQELTAGEGGATRSTGQILAEMIADTFGEDIKASTGVDILQVETNDGSSDDDQETAEGVKVTVGKHLSDRMTVKYAVETKDGQVVQRAITEYKLLENILVSGFQDTKGIYGSELVFRIEFR